MSTIIKSSSIVRRRAGRKGWATRRQKQLFISRMREVIAAKEQQNVIVVERQVLRTTKENFLKANPGTPEIEVISFARAVAELYGTCTVKIFEEKLDAGEPVETRKAVYTLFSSKNHLMSESAASQRGFEELSQTTNLLMRARR